MVKRGGAVHEALEVATVVLDFLDNTNLRTGRMLLLAQSAIACPKLFIA